MKEGSVTCTCQNLLEDLRHDYNIVNSKPCERSKGVKTTNKTEYSTTHEISRNISAISSSNISLSSTFKEAQTKLVHSSS